jgi:uncharacterized membrane protein YgaE (UPF0421/DUF939 family)
MELSAPAYTILGLNIVQIIGVIIFLLMSKISPGWKTFWIFVCMISMGIGAVLMTGVINCMVYGNCTTFAWLIVGLFIVYFILALLSSIAYYTAGNAISMKMKSNMQPEFTVEEKQNDYTNEDQNTKKRYYQERRRRESEEDDYDYEEDEYDRRRD